MLATTFLHMLQTIYSNYKARLSDLTFFEDIMGTCVDLLNALCLLFISDLNLLVYAPLRY